MSPDDPAFRPFLASTSVIDWHDPAVTAQAAALARASVVETARTCFEFVRDHVQHSRDYERDPSTWRASDVLNHRTGYCYAKSHLLAALLRANGVPAGLCYQRLSVNDTGGPYCLHGFNAVHLPPFGWYRVDARGNKPGVDAQFTPPVERLAFPLQSAEEFEFDNVWPEPLRVVLDVLQTSAGWEVTLSNLPDVRPADFERLGLVVRRTGPGPV